MVASGATLTLIGVWLVLQSLGGNLAGRIRSAATTATFGSSDAAPDPIQRPDDPPPGGVLPPVPGDKPDGR